MHIITPYLVLGKVMILKEAVLPHQSEPHSDFGSFSVSLKDQSSPYCLSLFFYMMKRVLLP